MIHSLYLIALALSLVFGAGYVVKDDAKSLYRTVAEKISIVEIPRRTEKVSEKSERAKEAGGDENTSLEETPTEEGVPPEEEGGDSENADTSGEGGGGGLQARDGEEEPARIADTRRQESPAVTTTPKKASAPATQTPLPKEPLSNPKENTSEEKPEANIETTQTPTTAPAPSQTSEAGDPTVSGVLTETNARRAQGGLGTLALNTQLSNAARVKALDMFARGYFAHEAPTGEGAGELATSAGYVYLLIGENLALGNYESSKVLVDAWMNSPGHRENIMRTQYQDIGLAVERGIYKGQSTLMAVQIFGRPQSACSLPSGQMLILIEDTKAEIADMAEELTERYAELQTTEPKNTSTYQQKVDEYNALVHTHNTRIEEIKLLISKYNEMISGYNQCVSE